MTASRINYTILAEIHPEFGEECYLYKEEKPPTCFSNSFCCICIIFVTFFSISCSIWADPIVPTSPCIEPLIDFLKEISLDIDIAERYNPILNKYEDNNTREWAATPYVGSIADVESEIP